MISTLLISPYLGAWVDLTPRLRAATTLTLVQVTSLLTHLGQPVTPGCGYCCVICQPWPRPPQPRIHLFQSRPPSSCLCPGHGCYWRACSWRSDTAHPGACILFHHEASLSPFRKTGWLSSTAKVQIAWQGSTRPFGP